MVLPREALGWLMLALVLLLPGMIATLLWAPFLLAGRIRALFEALPPRGSLVPSYVAIGLGASLPYVLGVLGIMLALPSEGAAWSNAILTLIQWVSVVYLLILPGVAILGLPAVGIDWDPTGYGATSWALLAVGTLWYALLFAIPLFVLAVLFAWPGGY